MCRLPHPSRLSKGGGDPTLHSSSHTPFAPVLLILLHIRAWLPVVPPSAQQNCHSERSRMKAKRSSCGSRGTCLPRAGLDLEHLESTIPQLKARIRKQDPTIAR